MTLSVLKEWVTGDAPARYLRRRLTVSQRFCREVVAWRTFRHPNVLPLLGATMAENRFVMVSEWMEKGNINEFLRANVDADRLGLVCFHPGRSSKLFTDYHAIALAWRCNSGVDLYAWSGDGPRGSQRSASLISVLTVLCVAYPALRRTS